MIHTSTRRSDAKGFTIVELLIVIVVIGILAAITIVAYNGVVQRADNAKTTSAAQAYIKGLTAYALVNHSYPTIASACLGTGYPNGNCWDGNIYEDTVFNNNLRSSTGITLPLPNTKLLDYFGGLRKGAAYLYIPNGTLDGKPYYWFLWYEMEGAGNKCTVGNVATMNGYPTFTTTPPASGYTENSVNPACFIPLPDPATL